MFDEAQHRVGEGLLPLRAKTIQDAPTPPPNGIAAITCARLYQLINDAKWRERGTAIINAFADRAADLGLYASTYLTAVDWHLSPITHLAIVGPPGDELADWMHHQALACLIPRRGVHHISPIEIRSRSLPIAISGMITHHQRVTGYACTGTMCPAPAETKTMWTETLDQLRRPRVAT